MPPKATQKHKRPTNEEAGPSTKKTRFFENPIQSSHTQTTQGLADEEEGLSGDAFANKVLEELENNGRARKRRVKTEGYDSDSSDDGEGVVESRKKSRRKDKGKDEDDDLDMFGGENENGSDGEAASAKKKETKFMSLGEIEGQEFGGGQQGTDDEDAEPEDEDAAARLAKKGMGYELSSFNMKDEMEEGKFAEDGTFVRSFDPHQVHDKWMDGMGDDEIKKARRSRKKMEDRERERERHHEEGLANRSKEELELELLDWVRPGESVLQTLGRLGAEKKKNEARANAKPKSKPKAAKAVSDPTSDEVDPGAVHRSQHPENSAIDRVTALASTLMSLGNLHIYEETHRTLAFSVKEAGLVPPNWVPPTAVAPPEVSSKYQYRWSPEYLASTSGGAKPGEIFGPFGKEELVAWRDASYFGPAGERVQLRKMGDEKWAGWGVVV